MLADREYCVDNYCRPKSKTKAAVPLLRAQSTPEDVQPHVAKGRPYTHVNASNLTAINQDVYLDPAVQDWDNNHPFGTCSADQPKHKTGIHNSDLDLEEPDLNLEDLDFNLENDTELTCIQAQLSPLLLLPKPGILHSTWLEIQ